MINYEGIFFDEKTTNFLKSLEKSPLDKTNDEFHCTFKYHPKGDEVFNELVGNDIEVYVLGYGHNKDNSGFEILLPDEVKDYYINYDEDNKLKRPHITASISHNGEAQNTKDLTFERYEVPYKIVGKFGYWIKEDDKEYLSFKKQETKKR